MAKRFTRVSRVGRIICLIAMILSSQVWASAPVFATAGVFENIAGVYTVRGNFSAYYLDNTRAARATAGTLTIVSNTATALGSIASASLTITDVGTIAMTGFVGAGTTPRISLIGSDGTNVVNINGRVKVTATSIRITGRADGWTYHSGGSLGDDPAGAAATWSTVAPHGGSITPLLTQAAVAGSTYVQYTPAEDDITLHDVVTGINAGDWNLWYKLQDATSGGPQLELRFTAPTNVNPDGAGHVDVTLLTPTTGTGAWVNRTYDSTFAALYYGNDPYDATAFDGPVSTVALMEAEINAEAAMLANGGFTCGDWVLSRIRVEIWEAGARTCYVDDVTINGALQSFEPVQYAGTFTGTYTIVP